MTHDSDCYNPPSMLRLTSLPGSSTHNMSLVKQTDTCTSTCAVHSRLNTMKVCMYLYCTCMLSGWIFCAV